MNLIAVLQTDEAKSDSITRNNKPTIVTEDFNNFRNSQGKVEQVNQQGYGRLEHYQSTLPDICTPLHPTAVYIFLLSTVKHLSRQTIILDLKFQSKS